MRAWQFHEPGDISNLVLEDVPLPDAGPGEAVIRITAAALNPADRYLVQGQYPRAGIPPFTPGRDGSGVVAHPAPGGRFQAGDRVCVLGGLTGISTPGLLAEYAPVPEFWLAPVPEGWTMEEAAAAPLVHLTAWRALVVCGGLQPGETVLITGASGGVGSAAVALAAAKGARVIALSRGEAKADALRARGASSVVDSNAPDLEKRIKAAAEGTPITLVVENLGGPFLEKCARVAGAGARIMVVGLLAGLTAEITLGLVIHKQLRLEGITVSAYTPETAQGAWVQIVSLLDDTGRRPPIDHVFPFTETQAAFTRLAEGPLGKIILSVC